MEEKQNMFEAAIHADPHHIPALLSYAELLQSTGQQEAAVHYADIAYAVYAKHGFTRRYFWHLQAAVELVYTSGIFNLQLQEYQAAEQRFAQVCPLPLHAPP